MMINKINQLAFNGIYEPEQRLKSSLNNINELNRLAEAACVDTIRTHLYDNRQFFPRDNVFTTIATKILTNNVPVFGVDCVILSKNVDNESISKSILESAQRALLQLRNRIGK